MIVDALHSIFHVLWHGNVGLHEAGWSNCAAAQHRRHTDDTVAQCWNQWPHERTYTHHKNSGHPGQHKRIVVFFLTNTVPYDIWTQVLECLVVNLCPALLSMTIMCTYGGREGRGPFLPICQCERHINITPGIVSGVIGYDLRLPLVVIWGTQDAQCFVGDMLFLFLVAICWIPRASYNSCGQTWPRKGFKSCTTPFSTISPHVFRLGGAK